MPARSPTSLLAGLLTAVLMAPPAAADAPARGNRGEIEGRARVVSGQTLHVGEREVRLWGIEAADINQPCSPSKTLTCGEYARIALQRLATGRVVTCRIKERPARAAYVGAQCWVRSQGQRLDLGQEMVRLGYAYAAAKIPYYAGYQLRIMPFKRPADWRAVAARAKKNAR